MKEYLRAEADEARFRVCLLALAAVDAGVLRTRLAARDTHRARTRLQYIPDMNKSSK